jgi:hypothetical protein
MAAPVDEHELYRKVDVAGRFRHKTPQINRDDAAG